MKNWLIGGLLVLQSVSALAGTSSAEDLNSPAALKARCGTELASDPALRSNDFHWDFVLADLITRFQEVYAGAKRLPTRAYWDDAQGSLMLPGSASRGGEVKVPAGFITSIQKHVEAAFENDYIDGVFFPDMGHSHFLIPETKFKDEYAPMPVSQQSRTYEKFFADPELRVVYHTAEQLRMVDKDQKLLPDRRVQWRFFSRNLVGDNRGEGRLVLVQNPPHKYNTTAGLPGYYWWGAGFNLSANKSGCIAYRRGERVEYFDLSLNDLVPEPGSADYQSLPFNWLRMRH